MSMRGGLGKGLGALIPTGSSPLEDLDVNLISPSDRQPRKHFEEEALASLADSMRQVGVLQPVVVRPAGQGRFELVVGERRWRAAQRAGLSTVPALVVETDDRGALERALIENLHRRDLNPIEEAAGYAQLIEEGGVTHETLAERVGMSRPAVTNSLRLLDLPTGVQGLIVSGKLSAGHGRALLGMGPSPLLERVAQRVAGEGLSVRQTEELVRHGAMEATPGRGRRSSQVSAAYLEVGAKLSEDLQTRVKVTGGARKGRIVIEFGSIEDLGRLYRLIRAGLRSEPGPDHPPAK